MSSQKISKDAKKFRESYEIGKVWLPMIVNGLYLIREFRGRHQIQSNELNAMFGEEGYFLSINNNADYHSDEYSIGKGNTMYICINSGMSLIPFQILPTNAVSHSISEDKSYMQYTKRKTPVFSYINYTKNGVQLPEGLDIMNLPEESLFQTELCINNKLVNGAAAWMGMRDFGFQLCEVLYYGNSLLQMKRLLAAVEAVVIQLREKYKDK